MATRSAPRSSSEALLHVLGVQLRRLRTVFDALERGDREPRTMHRLRVAARRAHVALGGLPGADDDRRLRALHRALDTLRAGSGPMRDFDVLLERTLPACAGRLPVPPDLLQALQAERERRRAALLEQVRALRPQVLDPETAAYLRAWPPATSPGTALDMDPLRRAHRRLRRRGKRFLRDGAPAEHRLRVAAKKLRYTLEALGDVLDADVAAAWRRRCRRLQDDLGALHDLEVACERLAAHADTPAQRAFVADFGTWCERQAAPLRDRVGRQVRALRALDKPWRHARLDAA